MFGFGKKKTPDPSPTKGAAAKGARPARTSGGARGSRGENTLDMFGVPGVDDPMNDMEDDDDLEDELLSLLGETGAPKKPKRPSNPPPPAQRQRGNNNPPARPPAPTAVLKDDFSDDDNVSDDDIDEGELEAELGELVGDPAPPPSRPQEPAPSAPTPTSSSQSSTSLLPLLQERLQLYEKAKSRADASGDTSKSRRFTRAIKTLKDLIKNASAGKVVDEADIPPIVALGEEKKIEAPPPEPDLPSFEPIAQVPSRSVPEPEPEPPAEAPPQLEPDPLAEARLKEYRKFAVLYKKSGDMQMTKHYFALSKSLEAAMKISSPVDLSAFPAPEIPVQEPPPPPAPVNPPSEAPPAEAPPEEGVPGIPAEIFGAPEAPKTIMEALEQRLEKYKSEVEKANSENNGSKARRMGRIVKQYQEAIALYKKGKPVPFDELPAPPGFAPIPVPSAGVAQGGGPPSVAPPASVPVPAPAPAPAPRPASIAPPPSEDTETASASNEGPSPSRPQGPAPSPSSKPSGQGPPGIVPRPSLGKQTLQQRQLDAILKRQQKYKDAALEAKKKGDLDQARELLRTAKGFDKLIQASHAGLPVDMNTLPSDPEALTELDAEGGFEVVSGDDCLELGVDADLAEVFTKLEEDLKNQLKTCMRNREHFKSIGDIGSANRFEKMALESKRDLDTLRLAARNGTTIPKYHYETRVFSITECNTDLTEDELEVVVMQGINYKVSNPADVDTYVRLEFPYPSAEEAQTFKTAVVKDTNNPNYNATFKMSVNRSARNFQRFIHRHGVKLEVWSKGGFLRGSTLIGTATAKLLGLETKCTVHDAFEVMEGRKSVGKLEVKIRLRDPVLVKQITQKKEKWLSIDRV